eukprot:jgi/Chrzof1/9798/Cz04g16020.t1
MRPEVAKRIAEQTRVWGANEQDPGYDGKPIDVLVEAAPDAAPAAGDTSQDTALDTAAELKLAEERASAAAKYVELFHGDHDRLFAYIKRYFVGPTRHTKLVLWVMQERHPEAFEVMSDAIFGGCEEARPDGADLNVPPP